MRPEFVLAGGIRSLVLAIGFGALLVFVACAANGVREPAPVTAKGAASEQPDGGVAGGASPDAAPAPKPFAGSSTEATEFIAAAIDKRSSDVKKCVADYRLRKKLPHERVEISVGIDQEGRLLGAAVKGAKADPVLNECVQRALANAPFPRSHAGVIQVTKSFEEIEQ